MRKMTLGEGRTSISVLEARFYINKIYVINWSWHSPTVIDLIKLKSFINFSKMQMQKSNSISEIHVKAPDEPGGYKESTVNFVSSLGSNTL